MAIPKAVLDCLERTFSLEKSDLASVPLSAGASMAMIGAYYFLQPLGDTLALSMGLEFTPLVTIGNMTLIILVNPIYAAVVRNLPTEAVVAVMFRTVIIMLLAFGALFPFFSQCKLLSFCFAVYVGTISLFTTTTLNARLASLHTKAEAKRVYGLIAAGSQLGQLISSSTAPFFFGQLGNLVVLIAAGLYECSVRIMACRSSVAARQHAAKEEAAAAAAAAEALMESRRVPDVSHTATGYRAASGGGGGGGGGDDGGGGDGSSSSAPPASRWLQSTFGGFVILASTPFLRAITGHTLLITFLVSGVWYERAAAVAAAFATDEGRYDFFATLNMAVGVLTLVLQTMCFSRILKVLGFHGTLLAEPLALAGGLIVAIVRPGLLSIAILDGVRKVVHYSLAKPTKEGLYAALPRDVIFIAKPLLDTLIYRLGSLLGAAYFTWAMRAGVSPHFRQYLLLAVTIVWMVNSWWVGILAERQQKEQEEEEQTGAKGMPASAGAREML